jgi:preprotein translocase SecF subunit
LNFEAPTDPAQTATPEKVAAHLGFLSNLATSQVPEGGIAISGNWARIDLDNQQVVQRLRVDLVDTTDLPSPSEPFLESTTIGSRVGTELRDSAIRAILLSFIAIVLYIRIRFREYRYGIAAIVALAHDISITLGVVALAHFAGFVDVEIDLAMIAAFLTIIGYSLNDTIVLFDRIRENLPRLTDKSYSEVLDISINQTLSRTLLTSMTTLVALIIIFVFNYGRQNVLEGFSFAMILGVLVGTYSSIFVASPVLIMIHKKHGSQPTNSPQIKGGTKKKGGKGQPGGVPA